MFRPDHPDAAAAREAVQRLIDRLEPLIRRRFRSRVRSVQHLYDLDDVMASLRRRIDRAWVVGRFGGGVPDESTLTKYTQQATTHIVASAMRRERRQQARIRHAQGLGVIPRMSGLEPHRSPNSDELERLLAHLLQTLETEQQALLRLWARGYSHREIAVHLGLSAMTLRTRLQRIKATVRVPVSGN